ncbi:MAG: ribosome maturation factor RimP [Bacillota bacterium]
MSRRDIEDKVFVDLEPLVARLGVELLDVELTSENRMTVLRATIYKQEGITLDDCAMVQNAISDRLDETDPVPGSYTLEVSSPGLERTLRRQKEFVIFKGMPVQVNLFAPVSGKRTYQGDLVGLTSDPSGKETVVISAPEGDVQLERANVSKVSLVYREQRDR